MNMTQDDVQVDLCTAETTDRAIREMRVLSALEIESVAGGPETEVGGNGTLKVASAPA